jgi:phosphoribosylaminoimidazolecarboxamide formyltransferase/IMP cyclohydrolase
MTQRVAFLSVFDKTGLEPFARTLVEQFGYALLSTGGTYKYLTERGIPVQESSEITGFEELLGGRVKSLHPTIFAGILAERHDTPAPADVELLIDLVVVNLYPFEQERDKPASNDPFHLLHFIDIGGSALIRAAAKNYPSVNVLCDANQYEPFLALLRGGDGKTNLSDRRQLAVRAFERSVSYDSAILAVMREGVPGQSATPDFLPITLHKVQDLRYGENPHQAAALYGLNGARPDFESHHGKELSFNNLLDLEAAWRIVSEFEETPACAIIKHNNPCGVAVSPVSIAQAYQTALQADPISAFGGIVACNRPVTAEAARAMKDVFLEVIVAPEFEPEAFEILSAKKNLRLVTRTQPAVTTGLELRQLTPDLYLAQTMAPTQAQPEDWTPVTENKPTTEQLNDLAFAWKVVKHMKSNAIVLAKDGRTVGMGAGQTSRIAAMEIALAQACDEAKGAALASDGFFPAVDNIQAAAQNRVGAIVQPGGSIKDGDVIAAANQAEMPMVTTGQREFKH